MLGSLYNSMTGLIGFTQSLDNLSNNVSNLNTPGFKGNDLIFRELGAEGSSIYSQGGNGGQDEHGEGVLIAGSDTRFTQGDIQDTGGETDIAIDGDAFFVLENDGEYLYTRSGQFRVDEDGFLVDPATGYKVVMLDENKEASYLNIREYELSEAEATTSVELEGILENSLSEGSKVPGDDDTALEVTLFDIGGKEYTANITFEKMDDNEWKVLITNEDGTLMAPTHTIDFSSLGTIVSTTSEYQFDFQNFSVLRGEDLTEAFLAGESMEFPDGLDAGIETNFEITDAQFIVRSDETFQFAQSGPFHFSDIGELVDADGNKVAALENSTEIVDFSIRDLLETPEELTQRISISGNLNNETAVDESVPPQDEDGYSLEFIGSSGAIETLNAWFVRVDDNQWDLLVEDSDGVNFDVNGSIYFDNDGNLITSTSALTILMGNDGGEDINIDITDELGDPLLTSLVEASDLTQESYDGKERGALRQVEFDENGQATLHYSNGDTEPGPILAIVNTEGDPIESITIDFSGMSGATSGSSRVSIGESDGRSLGQVIDFGLNANGEMEFTYSNGDEQTSSAIALANILDKSQLQSIGGTLFKLDPDGVVSMGTVSTGAAKLEASSLELSNVELSREFADIIIVQRGYQASSQVLNVTNELIEELYNSVKGR